MVTGIVAKYAQEAEIQVYCASEEMSFKPKAIIKALKDIGKKSGDSDYYVVWTLQRKGI